MLLIVEYCYIIDLFRSYFQLIARNMQIKIN